jgi:hypothetical protein
MNLSGIQLHCINHARWNWNPHTMQFMFSMSQFSASSLASFSAITIQKMRRESREGW